jgi:FkbM family methyltransferase
MNNRLSIAESSKFRRPGLVERAGEVGRRLVPGTGVRQLVKRAYHALLDLRTGGRGLECRLPGGESVRIDPAYRYVSWNTDEYCAFKSALGPGKVAFDIGANVGCYSMLFGQWVGAEGRVFAFEPSPATFSGLERHVALNRLGGVVRPIQAAVSDESATAEFLMLDNQGMSRLAVGVEGDTSPRAVRVPTVSVDEFCAGEGVTPDLMKIDVEGFELAVLRGARETIRRAGARLALFVEMHPTTWAEIGTSKEEMISELEAQGLEAEPPTGYEDMWSVEGICLRLRPRRA